MKKTNTYIANILLFIVMACCGSSCKKDFLDVVPKGSLVAQNVSDYDQLLNGVTLSGFNADPQIPMGDEVSAIDPYYAAVTVRNQRLFSYADDIYDASSTSVPLEISIPSSHIYLCNKIINEVMNAANGTDAQKLSIKAEAQVHRAFAYFMLINYYGKPYNASTAATDPGYPIITTADATATGYTRASVKDVYDFMVTDLTTAIPNLPANLSNRIRVCKAAAEGMLGKVYVFMGNYKDALTQLNNAFTDAAASSIPAALYDYNTQFVTGGVFGTTAPPSYPAPQSNQESLLTKTSQNTWSFSTNEMVLNPATVALYGTTDFRRKFLSPTTTGGIAYPTGFMRRFAPTSSQIGVILPDMYLLRAECKARTNDLAGAKADVETLRFKRMPAAAAPVPPTIAADPVQLTTFILQERIREFSLQGFRWFDMRRLSVDPVYGTTVNYTHTYYSATGTITSTFTLPPNRLTLRFSAYVILQNPMTNNP